MLQWIAVSISEYSISKSSIFSILLLTTISLLAIRLGGRTLGVWLTAIALVALCIAAIDNYHGTFGPERGTVSYQLNSFVFGVFLIPPTNVVLIMMLMWIISRPSDAVLRRKFILIPALFLSLLFEFSFLAAMQAADKLTIRNCDRAMATETHRQSSIDWLSRHAS
ncbi:hypothetical protein [Rhizobium leguminosarum]|uniref:hypothetical protein n=1 Tax=Rhizobium leguminosarum TaxID=384 RepID=UPI001F329459|nr:hypothetical protein [Rhizobium leguminosarum]UIJ81818.1 hypothetical protein LZK78_11295 [Rhizobium leguminosarum]